MKLEALNKVLRWFGLVLVVELPDPITSPGTRLYFERAKRWPLREDA